MDPKPAHAAGAGRRGWTSCSVLRLSSTIISISPITQGAILDEFLEIDTFQGTGVQPGVVLEACWRSQAVIPEHRAVIPLRQALNSERSAIILGFARHGGQASPAPATGPPRSRLPGLCSCVACGFAISLNSTHVRAHGRQL